MDSANCESPEVNRQQEEQLGIKSVPVIGCGREKSRKFKRSSTTTAAAAAAKMRQLAKLTADLGGRRR